ncbi:MAG: ABC transporter substrate-binding protein [Acidobacteriota bacterium]
MTGKTMLHALLLTAACACMLRAQQPLPYDAQAETMFLLGVRQFVQQDYASAYQTLRQTAELEPMHQRTTAAMIMAAKSANALHQYEHAAELCRTFLERFPYSSYVEDAHYTLGLALGGMERTRDAASEMLAAAGMAGVDATRWRAEAWLERYALSFTPNVLRSLEAGVRNDSSRVLLMLLRGEAYMRRGEKDSAAEAARAVTALTSDPRLLRRAKRLFMETPSAAAGDTVVIGVLLPLMNNYAVQTREGVTAREILSGIRLALREYANTGAAGRIPVALDVRDSQRDTSRVRRIIEEWKGDSSTAAILGPLYSDETSCAAACAEGAKMPLLTPTATGNDIASIGDYVFQANPDYHMRGTLMAQYAVRIAGAKNVAIITSEVFPAPLLAEAFAQEAARLGAAVVSYQKYPEGVTDFRHLFRAITTDASKIEGGSLQAVYCPIASSLDIGVIASQLRLLDPKIMILGSDEWNDDEELDRNRTSADGVIFSSDRWAEKKGQPVSGLKFESFGYDAASLLLEAVGISGGAREELRSVLSRVNEYDGIHSKIIFGPERVNEFIHILQYRRGFIKKIGEVAYEP